MVRKLARFEVSRSSSGCMRAVKEFVAGDHVVADAENFTQPGRPHGGVAGQVDVVGAEPGRLRGELPARLAFEQFFFACGPGRARAAPGAQPVPAGPSRVPSACAARGSTWRWCRARHRRRASSGSDQQARRPNDSVNSRGPSHNGSVAMSVTITGSLRYAAVPHEPTLGSDFEAVDRAAEIFGQGSAPPRDAGVRPSALQQQDGTQRRRRQCFDRERDAVERVVQRRAVRHQVDDLAAHLDEVEQGHLRRARRTDVRPRAIRFPDIHRERRALGHLGLRLNRAVTPSG